MVRGKDGTLQRRNPPSDRHMHALVNCLTISPRYVGTLDRESEHPIESAERVECRADHQQRISQPGSQLAAIRLLAHGHADRLEPVVGAELLDRHPRDQTVGFTEGTSADGSGWKCRRCAESDGRRVFRSLNIVNDWGEDGATSGSTSLAVPIPAGVPDAPGSSPRGWYADR